MTNEASDFAPTLLVHQLLFHKRRQQERGSLTHVLVLDEGLSSWNAQANNIDRQTVWGIGETLASLIQLETGPITRFESRGPENQLFLYRL